MSAEVGMCEVEVSTLLVNNIAVLADSMLDSIIVVVVLLVVESPESPLNTISGA